MNENQIDRYLLNLLNPQEKKAFENDLKNNDTLLQEVEQQRNIVQDIEGMGRIELKSKLKTIHKQLYPESQNPKTKIRRLIFRIAAAAALFGVLSLGWWCLQQDQSTQGLYSQNFEPYELSLNQRSAGDITLNKIEDLYLDGEYAQAIPLFQDILKNSETPSSQILLGLGISYLQTQQPKKAINQFNTILANKDFNFEDEAQWYMGLAYLKLNDVDKAVKHFGELASDPTKDHHLEAKNLISQLN